MTKLWAIRVRRFQRDARSFAPEYSDLESKSYLGNQSFMISLQYFLEQGEEWRERKSHTGSKPSAESHRADPKTLRS